MFLDVGHLLGSYNDVQDLDDLGGLDTDAGEADPCLVAGAVVLTEDDQRHQQQHVHRTQQLPLGAEDVGVDDGEENEGADTEEHGEELHRDVLRRGGHIPAAVDHADHGLVHHQDAKDGAYGTNDEQEDIRPLEKLFDIRPEQSDVFHRLSPKRTKIILPRFCSLRNV